MSVKPTRDVFGADQSQKIIQRAVDWAVPFVVEAVKAMRRDGRPLFTKKIPEQERLLRLLTASKPFWDALQEGDPKVAAAMAADILKARAKGTIPEQGPLVNEAQAAEGQGTVSKQGPQVGEAQAVEDQENKFATKAPPLGTQRAYPLPPFIISGAVDTTSG